MDQMIQWVMQFVDLFLHLDRHLNELVILVGPWLYLIVFLIIFCETGLVVMPFLPGDSLLFALGALAAIDGSPLNVWVLGVLLFIAAVLGDATNYAIGFRLGPKVFKAENSRFLNRDHLLKAQQFYEKHGGKTIIIARFIPIIRTFAPFVAGIGKMSYQRFASYNIVGAFCWVVPFLLGGYFLGNLPAIKSNFHIVIVVIIILSVMPAVYEFWKSRQSSNKAPNPAP
jgi:membrane-associated protein